MKILITAILFVAGIPVLANQKLKPLRAVVGAVTEGSKKSEAPKLSATTAEPEYSNPPDDPNAKFLVGIAYTNTQGVINTRPDYAPGADNDTDTSKIMVKRGLASDGTTGSTITPASAGIYPQKPMGTSTESSTKSGSDVNKGQ